MTSSSPCDYCTGTFHLSDDPDLGPCVCVTPIAMQRLTNDVEVLTERLQETHALVDEAKDAADDAREQAKEDTAEIREKQAETDEELRYAWETIGHHVIPADERLGDAIDTYVTGLDADALPALRGYLVSLGYPADPVTQGAMPRELWAVYDALT